jgi:hypothetical protein
MTDAKPPADRGGSLLEYSVVIIIIAALVGVTLSVIPGLGLSLASSLRAAACSILDGEDCDAPEGDTVADGEPAAPEAEDTTNSTEADEGASDRPRRQEHPLPRDPDYPGPDPPEESDPTAEELTEEVLELVEDPDLFMEDVADTITTCSLRGLEDIGCTIPEDVGFTFDEEPYWAAVDAVAAALYDEAIEDGTLVESEYTEGTYEPADCAPTCLPYGEQTPGYAVTGVVDIPIEPLLFDSIAGRLNAYGDSVATR